ncbi:SGNH/GDSL hydrolase family protein [Acidimicrobiia bacterium EGI L10123]|uniref:SGNH/GDSL hydrolase family protein n=1 Tax=Salinilacustrithrix flava TaxID=2957203 RepID=UPI003D7C18C9|nr:SGNH/GDSL hydrolase family protein [Acidimicrobiia bacterium EGI L10123]
MTTHPARPLRISVVGSSVAYFVTPRVDPDGGNYGERLEARLYARGVPALVRNEAGWLMRVDEIVADAERRILGHSPQVVIIDVGWVECQPLVLPLPLLRWTFSWRANLSPRSLLLRRAVRPVLKRAHLRWGPAWIRRGGPVPDRLPLPRFRAELERLIDLVAERQRALVLLLNVPPTAPHLDEVLPGIQERAARYSRAIDDLVTATGSPDVRLIDVRAIVDADGLDAVLPDGIHLNAAGHELVAERLEAEVVAWLHASSTSGRADSPGGRQEGQPRAAN